MEEPRNDQTILPGSPGFNIADLVKRPHNVRLYKEVQNLKKLINDLVDYQLAHPKIAKPTTREEIDNDKKSSHEIEKREKYIRAQLSIIKGLYRQSVLKVREEKANTSDDRAVNDALILGLHNLKYEEQSLRSEISAAENYEYVQHPPPIPITDRPQSQVYETPSHPRRGIPRAVSRPQRILGTRPHDSAHRTRAPGPSPIGRAPTRETQAEAEADCGGEEGQGRSYKTGRHGGEVH
jgi:hypothetical protein